jgi:hypothetical protein
MAVSSRPARKGSFRTSVGHDFVIVAGHAASLLAKNQKSFQPH